VRGEARESEAFRLYR
jgi:hypothetical protein